ncbi:hypothetical protein BDK51DRAFT_37711 [Blyttiomyces helicus]|uniref:Uncharacterized protein n=1 Tax=Blyttiomyces helicus TaxID=388810 RepID=A0A4P9WRD4_9FUNG|nr:hypothetical protein BDK51DRAFT_37711 [Blyttiomyces helicus]|eukprot:RKO94418.1 hypothetical protein BDK51DRAFT_37711 [Blyttiomyces helicus]
MQLRSRGSLDHQQARQGQQQAEGHQYHQLVLNRHYHRQTQHLDRQDQQLVIYKDFYITYLTIHKMEVTVATKVVMNRGSPTQSINIMRGVTCSEAVINRHSSVTIKPKSNMRPVGNPCEDTHHHQEGIFEVCPRRGPDGVRVAGLDGSSAIPAGSSTGSYTLTNSIISRKVTVAATIVTRKFTGISHDHQQDCAITYSIVNKEVNQPGRQREVRVSHDRYQSSAVTSSIINRRSTYQLDCQQGVHRHQLNRQQDQQGGHRSSAQSTTGRSPIPTGSLPGGCTSPARSSAGTSTPPARLLLGPPGSSTRSSTRNRGSSARSSTGTWSIYSIVNKASGGILNEKHEANDDFPEDFEDDHKVRSSLHRCTGAVDDVDPEVPDDLLEVPAGFPEDLGHDYPEVPDVDSELLEDLPEAFDDFFEVPNNDP